MKNMDEPTQDNWCLICDFSTRMGFFKGRFKGEGEQDVPKRIPGWSYTNRWYCVAKALSQFSSPVHWNKGECPIDPDGVSQWITCRLTPRRRGATGSLLWLMLTVIEKLASQLDGAREKLQDMQNKNTTKATAQTVLQEASKVQIAKVEALEAELAKLAMPSLGTFFSVPTPPLSEPEQEPEPSAPPPASPAFSQSPSPTLSHAPSPSGSAPSSSAISSAHSPDPGASSDASGPAQIQPTTSSPQASSPHQQAPALPLTPLPVTPKQVLTPDATSPPGALQQLPAPPITSSSAPPRQAPSPLLQIPALPLQVPQPPTVPQPTPSQQISPDPTAPDGRTLPVKWKRLMSRARERDWTRTFREDNYKGSPLPHWERKRWVRSRSASRGRVTTDLRGQQSAFRDVPSLTTYELASLTEKYQQKPGESLKAWILKVLDKGADSLVLDAKALRSLGPLTRDVLYNAILRGAPLEVPYAPLLDWCIQCWRQRWPFRADHNDPLPSSWMSLEDAVQHLREEAMIEWIYLGEASGLAGPNAVILSNHNRAQLIHSAPLQWKSLITALLSEHRGTIGEMISLLREHLSRNKVGNILHSVKEERRPIPDPSSPANCRAPAQHKERNSFPGLSEETGEDSETEAQVAKVATWV
ncbi:uncharacterized protein [Notamacropus eugenii]|uniref:uncharacterized protein n=1 Tax=Notamacropus eugenii TaxID=9315 RepID=UPI003B67D4C2